MTPKMFGMNTNSKKVISFATMLIDTITLFHPEVNISFEVFLFFLYLQKENTFTHTKLSLVYETPMIIK